MGEESEGIQILITLGDWQPALAFPLVINWLILWEVLVKEEK
jgi:hypothetical protein